MLPKGLLKEYSGSLAMLTRFMDMGMIFVAGMIAYYIRFQGIHFSPNYLVATLTGMLAASLIFHFFDIYSSVRGKGLVSYFFNLVQAVCILALILACLAFFTKSGDNFSRLWFLNWMSITLGLLILCRSSLLCALRYMRAHGLNERRVVIYGANELGTTFAKTVQQALWTGFRVVNFLDDQAHSKPDYIHHIPVSQAPENLGQFLTDVAADEIWLALPLSDEPRVKMILHELRHHTINTRFVLDIFGLNLLNHSMTEIAGFPVLNISSTPMMGVSRMVKAVEDRLLSALIILLVSPVLLLAALGVKLSSKGPVLFKQHRLGWDGRVIKVYKFRTMYQHEEVDGAVTQATLDDKRVTPFGRFLRRTSLDELPQFMNVLQGRMSIVGPRPHALAHNELYKDAIKTYMQRHRVKPGITGWAQINGWRGETDTLAKMQKRVEYDLYYINNWSLGFDLKIIFLTFIKGFSSRNAY